MKNTNKKGFTIVELVIVIAVIAILAAVLIPTFVGLVNKANLSADQQAVRQMNQAIAMTGETIDGLKAAIDALDAQGYNSKKALVPVSKDHTFYWDNVNKKVILVKGEGEEAVTVFPEDVTYVAGNRESLESGYIYVDITAADNKTLAEALADGNEKITLDSDVELSKEVNIPADTNVTLDLNGKTLKTTQTTGRSKYLNVEGTLTVVNGTVEARGIQVFNGGKLVIAKESNVTVNNADSNGGAAIWVYEGGEVEINGGTFTALNGVKDSSNNYKYNPGVINNSGKVTINDGTFKSAETICYLIQNSGEMVINDGTFEGTHGIIAAYGNSTTTINGGTFTLKAYEDGEFDGHVIYSPEANVTINGGTFGGYTSVFHDSTKTPSTTDTGIITDNRANQ